MSFLHRMIEEREQLSERVGKLLEFIRVSDTYKSLSDAEKNDLQEQAGHMSQYLRVLVRRISREEAKAKA